MAGKQSPQVMTGFLLVGVAVVGLFAYSMSLRTENQRLLDQIAELEGGSGSSEVEGEGDEGSAPDSDTGEVELPADPVPTADDTVAVGDLVLGPAERATLASQLGFIEPGGDRRVWLTVTFGDPGSARFATELAEVFDDAGFEVQPTTVARFTIRPGMYFMAAEEEPPEHVNAILAALEATGYEITSGRGYREFYAEKKREDPEWNGFEMTDEQPFVIAIGRSGS